MLLSLFNIVAMVMMVWAGPLCPENCADDQLCVKMFLFGSDFMEKCGHLFAPTMLQTMFNDCEEHRCEGWFEWNIEKICQQKGAPPYTYRPCGPGAVLYPFGQYKGDNFEPSCDDCVEIVNLEHTIDFVDDTYNTIYICENGLISFTLSDRFAYYDGDWLGCKYYTHSWDILYGFMVYSTDADPSQDIASHVMYRESTDADLLQRATYDVINNFATACSSGFEAESLFVVTWYLMRPYDNWTAPCFMWYYYYYILGMDDFDYDYGACFANAAYHRYTTEANTHQLVLINGGSDVYAMFIYHQTEWIENNGYYPSVGISYGIAVNRSRVPPYEGLHGMSLISESNIGQDGVYLYKVSGSQPLDTQCNAV